MSFLSSQWERIGVRSHHGISLPLFSLHSSASWGIGEFPDLLLLIDWAVAQGFDIIQLLPLQDTGWGESPYSAISAFAINPLYIGLEALPYLHESDILRKELSRMRPKCNACRVEYDKVRAAKEAFLSLYLDLYEHLLLESPEYQQFTQDAAYWLEGYTHFKVLKKRFQLETWEKWPPLPSLTFSLEEQKLQTRISLIQNLADAQLCHVKAHANLQKLFLMGDLPILINRDSADVWEHQSLFDLSLSAGTPPDLFSLEGQNWGFPLYHWHQMKQTGYRWWKERLKTEARHSDLYRIDHIVGFFRIWAFSHDDPTKKGRFYPEEPALWIQHGTEILKALIEECPMLPIGEDLGTIPPAVRTALHSLGICGTKVMRWERYWEGDKGFIPIDLYPPDSLSTLATHDTETLKGWWQDFPEEAKQLAEAKGWPYQPLLNRTLHKELIWDSEHTASLFHINPLQEYLSLFPDFSWSDPSLERINIPGTLSIQNWSCRLRPSLETFTTNASLAAQIRDLIR